MSDLVLLLQLQARVTTFLAGLGVDDLAALADGRLVLATSSPAELNHHPAPMQVPSTPVAPPSATTPRKRTAGSAEPFDADAVVTKLRAAEKVDDVAGLLKRGKITAPNLKLVAKALQIPDKGTMDELARKILNITVVARAKHAALRQG